MATEFGASSGVHAPLRHEVLFYSDDAVFLDSLARFIGIALRSGDVAIVAITESHGHGLVLRLKAQGLDVDAATQQGRYIQLDVAKTLSTFMVNDMPHSARLFEVARDLIHSAAKAAKGEHSRVVACGEGVALLWAEGKADAAIRLEQLWDQIGKNFEVDILFGNALGSFSEQGRGERFPDLFAGQPTVFSPVD